MESRLRLDAKLREILGSGNVYFQPPESVKMQYPCIVYELSDMPTEKADNQLYIINDRYTITLIHRDPDNDLKKKILLELQPYCELDRVFTSANLYHYVYNLYY